MNKSHRVIWSAVRNCFVVASEVAKAKGKPSSTRKAVAVAVATLFIAPGVASAVEDVGQELVGAPSYTNNYVNNGTLEATALNANGFATAYGVRVGDIAGTGSVGNTGTITANATADVTTATAALAVGYGIKADSLGSTATISNDGTINVNTNAFGAVSSAQGYGIYVDGDADGTITNATAGNINLNVTGNIDPEAYGVYVGGNLNGAIDNSGNIKIEIVNAASADLKAYGVYVGGDIVGSVTNKGTITLNLDPVDQTYVGAGIYTKGNLGVNGKIDNQGAITVSANDANGIYVDKEVDGQILNSGDINVSTGITGVANASGISVGGNLNADGVITNAATGNITVNATADDTGLDANAYGIKLGIDLAGAVTNNGTITSTADAGAANANAFGVRVGGNLLGTLTNTSTGTLSATATANTNGINTSGEAQAYGVAVASELSGELDNAGTISATATAFVDNAEAAGVNVESDMSGTVTNSGSLSASATVNGKHDAFAYGVRVGANLTGTLTNTSTGTIAATATVTDVANAYAYGVYVLGNLTNTGKIDNEGTINITAKGIDSDVHAYAYGVYVGGDVSGVVSNSGTIKLDVLAGTDPEAYGVYVGGDLLGSVVNSGTIDIKVDSTNSDLYAYGINVQGDVTGSILNSGTIKLDLNPQSYIYTGAGIYTKGDVGLNGKIENKGTITVDASTDTGEQSKAYGIYVNGDVNGQIINSNTITISSEALSNVEAYGVYVGVDLAGTFTNSGTITADATVNGNDDARAYGVRVSGKLTGTLTNTSTGEVTATATATNANSNATAYGVYVNSDITATGSLTNAGTITATATISSDEAALAYGVYVNNGIALGGTLTNSGVITATATANPGLGNSGSTANAYAYGIRVNGILAGSLSNTGTIKATASGDGTNGSSQAYGVSVNNLTGTITNSGTISASTDNEDPNGFVFSMAVFNGTGSITNQSSGVLDGKVFAAGTVNLINDGLINTRLGDSAVGGDYSQSATGVFRLSALSDSNYGTLIANNVSLTTGTTISVAVSGNGLTSGDTLDNVIFATNTLNMSTVKVLDNSLALNFTAEDDGSNGVDLTAVGTGVTSVQSAVLASGLSSASNAGSVIDSLLAADSLLPLTTSPTQLSSFLNTFYALNNAQEVTDKVAELLPVLNGNINNATLDTMRMLNLAVNQRMDQQGGMSSGDLAFSNEHFWFKPFGSWANQDKRSGSNGYDARSYGIAFGADGQLTEANTVGLAFAYARTDVDADGASQKADVDSYQAGLYGSYKISDVTSLNYQADFAYHDNSARRTITGVGTAKSDFDSWSGHLGATLAYSIPVDEATTFTPSIRADYSRIRAESYTEKGAGVLSLNVGNMTTEQFIVGADGKLVRKISDNASAFANFGVGYDVINERTSVTSSFAGVPGAVFTTRGVDPSPWLMRGGLGLVGQATESLELSLRYDFEVRNDFDNHTASVKARWAF